MADASVGTTDVGEGTTPVKDRHAQEEWRASEHRVRVASGKYTFVHDGGGTQVKILRYEEPWHSQEAAFNALYAIMCELDAARVVVTAARKLANAPDGPMSVALRKHAALSSDHELPSAWTSTPPPASATVPPATPAEKLAALEYARTVLDHHLSRVLDSGVAHATTLQVLDDILAVGRRLVAK